MKKARQTEKSRLRNRAAIHAMRTEMKKLNAAVAAGEREPAQQRMRALSRQLDKLVSKGIIPKNQASRQKSRIALKVSALLAAKPS